jgi:hypothetical protein
MGCSICESLERTYEDRLSEYREARSSAGYQVSTKLAAHKNVEMERARYELEEHRMVCGSARKAPLAHLPVFSEPASSSQLAA